MKKFNPSEIESKWQQVWDDNQTYRADLNSGKPKYIAMSMFNYPSGAGIHIGHAMNYTISDVMARYKRQQGFESYHPVGWDAFGLPAENYAIKTGISPQQSMSEIIPSYHRQYKAMGWSNDWSKEISTHLPAYYKWTQWIFSQMYKNGLAYQDSRMQWWCDSCQTVLANEQIIEGKCWRHDSVDDPLVTKKEVKQWFFKITEYADEMLEATDSLDWSEVVKVAQKNWIGKSKGAEITFHIAGLSDDITVFTTRPDTLYGVTFLVVAPENDILNHIVTDQQKQSVENYIKEATKRSEVERQSRKEKTGVFTGAYAVNPINNEKIPVWVADYVLAGYGTGAIMAVPAHDERDNEFATQYNLPIRQVIAYSEEDSKNPPVEGQEEVERETVIVHLLDKSSGKFALLNWHGSLSGVTTAVMGGIEDGQTPESAALAEIEEEVGLTDVRIVSRNQWVTISKYNASHKGVNRKAVTHVLLAEVDNLDGAKNISDDEKALHTVEWVDRSQVSDKLTPDHQKYVWSELFAEAPFTQEGELINSGKYNGLSSNEARELIVAELSQKKLAEAKTTFKIRDWSVSRQRYWGAPIPVVNCPVDGVVLIEDSNLPVELPEMDDFRPSGDGRSALARVDDWINVTCPKCGGEAQRETDTLDTYICSSWYFLRYIDPVNADVIFDSTVANKWMPIDFYNGGDHATAHMIYARFVTRFLHKLGLLDNPEPFKRFLFNGKVTAGDGQMFSKSKGNGVDPLEIINQGYGADALRIYLMFAAPLDLWVRWDPQGVPGAYRFLNRVWNITQDFINAETGDVGSDKPLWAIHKAIKKVTEDLEDQKYNTAIAAMMKATNELYDIKTKDGVVDSDAWREAIESLIMLVAPFAPHTAEELWHEIGHTDSIHVDHWPSWDEKYLTANTINLVVQINGKLRAAIETSADIGQEEAISAAKSNSKIADLISGKEIKKTIYVPGKLVNLVI